jgi:SAM-dependent methyltransferase
MPAPLSHRQPGPAAAPAGGWFDGPAGRAILDSEAALVAEALQGWPGRTWLRCTPAAVPCPEGLGPGLSLVGDGEHWVGELRCGAEFPLGDDSMASIVLQHVADFAPDPVGLLAEAARVLEPRGTLWLLALNPLTPYRRHWTGTGIRSREPVGWRRRLRAAGLHPDTLTTGLGPRWSIAAAPQRQDGVGLRAAYVVRAHKRVASPVQPDPIPALRWQAGLPA